jgi:hypothetical protein
VRYWLRGTSEDANKSESGFRDIANMIAEPRIVRSVMCSTGFEAINQFNKLQNTGLPSNLTTPFIHLLGRQPVTKSIKSSGTSVRTTSCPSSTAPTDRTSGLTSPVPNLPVHQVFHHFGVSSMHDHRLTSNIRQ